MEPRKDGSFWSVCFGSSPRERQAAGWFSAASLAWAASWVAAAYVFKHELAGATASLAVAAVPGLFAVSMVLVFARYLRELDELQRRIQLGALAFSLGATWVAIATYPLFETAGAPKADSAPYIMVMVLAYTAGNIVAWIRYR